MSTRNSRPFFPRLLGRLFKPGAWVLNRMPTAGKFSLLGVLMSMPLAWLAWSEVEAQLQHSRLVTLHHSQVSGLPEFLRVGQVALSAKALDADVQREALAALERFRQAWAPAESISPVNGAVQELQRVLGERDGGDLGARSQALQGVAFALNAGDMAAHGSASPDPFSSVILMAFPELVRAARLNQLAGGGADYPAAMLLYRNHVRMVSQDDARAALEVPADLSAERFLQELERRQQAMTVALGEEMSQRDAESMHRLWAHSAALGGLLLLVFYMAGSLQYATMRRLATMQTMVAAMEHADFSSRLRVDGHDEVADMLASMNLSFDRLTELIRVVQSGASAVQFATEQLASGNTDLSDRNQRTIGGLQDVVASVARYATQLQACGAEVERMAETIQKLRMDSANSRKQMARLQERMDELRNHSQDISQIVGLIDAIAFRTNVLALNASIEASKAGEAGRGFAVVAQEVRSLAMRSADSSRKIADIVRRSTEDIDLGAAMAEEAGRVIMGSEGYIDEVHQAIAGVAQLTREGEDESKAILSEIKTLSEVTERNTDLVNQLANASRALHSQGSTLTEKVNQFQVG